METVQKYDYSEWTDEQINTMNFYLENEMKELKKICHKVGINPNIPQDKYDDLYSDAMDVLMKSLKTYSEKNGTSFETYLSNSIKKSQITWYRDEYLRSKRNNLCLDKNGKIKKDKNGKPIILWNVSIDQKTDENYDLAERIESNFNIENEILAYKEESLSDKVREYLDNLSIIPRKMAKMIMDGENKSEIKMRLKLSDFEYREYWKILTSYENKRILYREEDIGDDDMNTKVIATEDVAESYKNTSYSIESISKQLQKKRIRDDHILQRHSGQWAKFAKSELISDILRGKSLTQIIISEEIKNGLRMQWLIDGKQRCTTLDDFLHDGFAISKNIKNYNIRYQTVKVDENGNVVLNEDGFTEMKYREFDIRGKKFSGLPEELQEIFKDRQIPVLYNQNCTKKDIADDIARFNRSRPMNVAQNGWLGLDESFAELAGNISKMQFFQSDFKGTSYTVANHTSGKIRRLIVEAIMVADFLDDFQKDFQKMCEFLSEEASDSNFVEFYSLIERLTAICNEEVSDMFNVTDSFLWIALFSKFAALGLDDQKFIDFMIAFEDMKDIKVDVTYDDTDVNSYNDLCINPVTGRTRGTKDKNMVAAKMKVLEKLMNNYFKNDNETGLSSEREICKLDEIIEEETENIEEEETVLDFVRKYGDENAIEEDLEMYEEYLEDVIRISSPLYQRCKTPLLAMVAYVMKNETDSEFEEWIGEYSDKNFEFFDTDVENYLHIKTDFEERLVA